MQTFLPYADFRQSAQVLDQRRLGKQRLEAFQILNVLADPAPRAWRHHPAVLMWRSYEDALRLYMNTVIEEWMRRGYRNTMGLAVVRDNLILPPWLGDERLHASHRANLLRKDADFYGQYGWGESPEMPYYWPVTLHGDAYVPDPAGQRTDEILTDNLYLSSTGRSLGLAEQV